MERGDAGREPLEVRRRREEDAVARLAAAIEDPTDIRPLEAETERVMLSMLAQGRVRTRRWGKERPRAEAEVARAILAHPDLTPESIEALTRRSGLHWNRDVWSDAVAHPSATLRVHAAVTLVSGGLGATRVREASALPEAEQVALGLLARCWDKGDPEGFADLVEELWAMPEGAREVALALAADIPTRDLPLGKGRGRALREVVAAARRV